ncbi:hypothetical protein [Actinoplanes philippinensis]|uniref:hypothetical protein n=1 Tax=Actinoplanes philippinensis TaxID=35752 RepID=UPI003F4CFFD9
MQFDGNRALVFKVIEVDRRSTYDGWIWLAGYVLDPARRATARRKIFVQHEGLRLLERTAPSIQQPARPGFPVIDMPGQPIKKAS